MDFKKKQKDKSLQINKIQISEKIIHSDSLYLYHKTSFRKIYDESYKTKKEFYDILFINERKELTESCVHNLFLKMDGIYFTPSIDSGILRGTLREYCLKKFPRWFQEKILVPEDLLKADKIILGNSVRGFTECIY
jgi:para-aminobenzoate synthetase/4-amino-4-deoxychorismate lyase